MNEPTDKNEPTIVLLHGAGTGPWIWDRVRAELPAGGLALGVPGRQPGATPQGAAAGVAAELDRRGVGRVMLVLHSLAGVLAGELSRRLGDRLAHVVFVAAVVPPADGAFVDALPLGQRLLLKVLFRLNRGGLKPSPRMIRKELCHDLSEEDAAEVVSRYQAELPGLYLTPAGAPPRLPRSAYVRLTEDRSVPPGLQDSMIARLDHPRVHEIRAGHLVMLSKPEDLARVLAGEHAAA